VTEAVKCGKAAGSLIPRMGMWYACVLEAGHEGECQRGGNCFKHGEYVGAQCPHWPECVPSVTELLRGAPLMLPGEVAGTVALDGDTRRCCNHPECGNDWPCAFHPDPVPETEYDRLKAQKDRILAKEEETRRARFAAEMEEKLPCGHRKANLVGDEGGTFFCEVCEAIKDTIRRVDAAFCGMPIPYRVTEVTRAQVTEKDRQRAQEFQQKLDNDASCAVGDRVWWASIRFPDVLAAEFAQVRLEGILWAQQDKNWIFKNEAGTVEIDFPATLEAVKREGVRIGLESVAGYVPEAEYQARRKALERP
jgi:hypothetical protein